MTDGHMYTPRSPQPDVLEGMSAIWGRCPRCSNVINRDYTVGGYCEDCAAKLIHNLSPTDIAQVWQKLDERKG